MIAVVEAKAAYKKAADGLQQAKDYAEILGLPFAYSTNGHGIVEFNFITGQESELDAFPSQMSFGQPFVRPTVSMTTISPNVYLPLQITLAV